MYSAFDIAKWFINRTNIDVENGGEYITHLKLQKLLYYAQGIYLAITDKPLFFNPIKHWTYGPVVEDVYKEYKEYGDNIIKSAKSGNEVTDESDCAILEEVYKTFAQFSAIKLSEMTHNELPWLNTGCDEVISQDSISKYFKANYIE